MLGPCPPPTLDPPGPPGPSAGADRRAPRRRWQRRAPRGPTVPPQAAATVRGWRRAPVRFGLLVVAIGLLVFLILVQRALQDGLITAFVGAVRNQSAPVLVYSVDGQRTLQGSVMPPPLEQPVRAVEGVGEVARIGQGTFTVRAGDGQDMDTALVGTDDADLVRPTDLTAGRHPQAQAEAVGSDVDFAIGDEVRVVPSAGRDPVVVTVVGLARDIQLSVTPTLFTDLATFEAAVRATNPDATTVVPNALAVRPVAGTPAEQVVDAVNGVVPDSEALARADAADTAPGVAQVRQSFQVIFLLYGIVVPLVTGLFFLIITLQKARSLTLLRALGARGATLARALLVQVVVVMAIGLALGIDMYGPVSQAQGGGLTLRFDTGAVLAWSIALLALGFDRGAGVAAPGAAHRPGRRHDGSGRGMRLALREMHRRPGRFLVAAAISRSSPCSSCSSAPARRPARLVDGCLPRPACGRDRLRRQRRGIADPQPHPAGGAGPGGGDRRRGGRRRAGEHPARRPPGRRAHDSRPAGDRAVRLRARPPGGCPPSPRPRARCWPTRR